MKKQALVVDNDFFFVEFLTEILQQRGYEPLRPMTARKELPGAQGTCPVDILFVEMVMPKIDGKQLIHYTRKPFPDALFPLSHFPEH